MNCHGSSMLGQMLLSNYIILATLSVLLAWTHQKYVKCNEKENEIVYSLCNDQNILLV